MIKDRFCLKSIFVCLAICFSHNVFATYPDVTGTYRGNLTGVESGCASPDTENYSVTLNLTGGSSGSFTGTGTAIENDGGVHNITSFSGSFSSSTAFTFTYSVTGPNSYSESGSGSGTVGSSSITFSATGTASPSGCTVTYSSTTLSTSSTVVSSTTPSSTVTDTVLFNTQIQSTVSDISKHITSALNGIRFFGGPRISDNGFRVGGLTGLNAGDEGALPYGVWGNYSYTDYDNDLSSTAFDGISHSFLGGIDFGVWDSTILGVSFGYTNSDIDTTFNGGNQDSDTFTVAPYFGAVLNDTLSVDFNVGYSRVDYNQFRTLTGTTTRVTSSPSADRWFSNLNLNAIKIIDRWIIGGRVGALYASSVIDGYTESNGTVVSDVRTKVGSASVAGDLAYSWQDFEPFVNLSYQYDFQLQKITAATGPQPSNDQDDLLLTTGVRYFEKSGITGNLEYSKRLTRDDFDEDRLSITVRVDY